MSSITTSRSSCQNAERTRCDAATSVAAAARAGRVRSAVPAGGHSTPGSPRRVSRPASSRRSTTWSAFGRIQRNISGEAGGGASGKAIRLIARAVDVLRHARDHFGARAERVVGLVDGQQALRLLDRADQRLGVHRLQRPQVDRLDLHAVGCCSISAAFSTSGMPAPEPTIVRSLPVRAHRGLVERHRVLLVRHLLDQIAQAGGVEVDHRVRVADAPRPSCPWRRTASTGRPSSPRGCGRSRCRSRSPNAARRSPASARSSPG